MTDESAESVIAATIRESAAEEDAQMATIFTSIWVGGGLGALVAYGFGGDIRSYGLWGIAICFVGIKLEDRARFRDRR